jgi:hypothetical protein
MEDDQFIFNERFFHDLKVRLAQNEQANDFADKAKDIRDKIAKRQPDDKTLKWANHGHLGGEAIWACIAKVLQRTGAPNDVCDQIERGMRNDKLKHGADVIAAGPHERRPLEWLARWLLNLERPQLT